MFHNCLNNRQVLSLFFPVPFSALFLSRYCLHLTLKSLHLLLCKGFTNMFNTNIPEIVFKTSFTKLLFNTYTPSLENPMIQPILVETIDL